MRAGPQQRGRVTLAGGDGPGLLLLGHTDVVPVGEGWTSDPFGGRAPRRPHLRPRRLRHEGWSRGVPGRDGALRRAGVAPTGPVELAALVDEEETGLGIRAYVGARAAAAGRLRRRRADRPADRRRRARRLLPRLPGARPRRPRRRPDDGAQRDLRRRSRRRRDRALARRAAATRHPLLGPATWSVGTISGGTGHLDRRRRVPWSPPTGGCCPTSRPRRGARRGARRGSTPWGSAERGLTVERDDADGDARLRDAGRPPAGPRWSTPPWPTPAGPGCRSAAGPPRATAASSRAPACRWWCWGRARSTRRTAPTSRSRSRAGHRRARVRPGDPAPGPLSGVVPGIRVVSTVGARQPCRVRRPLPGQNRRLRR